MTQESAGSTPDIDADKELAFLLARAGIVLTPEQFAGVASEWPGFRTHVELVNQSFEAAEEPATIFDVAR
jgi:hypothetical protein